jgi:similar to stage IV sporulation protein
VLVIFLFSTRVWNIHLEGNILNSTPQLLEFLEANGIRHGMAKSKVNCSEIADLLRQNYPEITWVSAKLTGTRLLLSVQEGQLKEEIQEEEAPCDIRANVEGTIVSMVTRTGIPLVKTGDLCQKGDLLVLGRLDILNDDQEVIRHEYVHADADIYIQYQLSYYEEFPLEYETEVLQDQVKKGFSIRLGNLYFSTFDKAEEGYLTSVEEFPLRLTENYILPVRWGRITAQKYEITTAVYSTEEAKSVADAHIARYEENLIQKGLQIFENNVKIDVTQTACISSGTFTVIEKAGTETAAQQLEEPEERTA